MGCSSKIQVYLLDDWTIPPYSSYVLSLLTSDTLQKSWMLAMCSLFFQDNAKREPILTSVNHFVQALSRNRKMKAAKAVTKTLQTQGLRMVTVDIKGGLNITMIFKRVGERDFRYRKPKPKINTLLSTQSIGFRVGCLFVGQWTKISINLDALYLYGP